MYKKKKEEKRDCGIFSLKALNYTQHYILVNIAVRFNYLFYFILKHNNLIN